MKRCKLLSAIILLLLPNAAFSAERFLIGMPEWCPYTCADKDKPGILVEITRTIFAEQGIEPEFRLYDNWKRLVYEGRKGRVDGVLAIGPSEEPALVYATTAMVDVTIAFFVRQDDDWKYEGLKSFEDKVILVFESVDYGPIIQPYIDEYKNDRSRVEMATGETEEVLIHKIVADRGDIYLEDKHVGLYMIQNEKLDGKVKLAPRNDTPDAVGLGLGLSPKFDKAKAYADILDKGIKQMKADGSYQAIIDRYIKQ